MDTGKLLEQLKGERAQLDTLIEGLQKRLGGSQSHAKAKGAAKPHGRHWTPQMRAQMSKRIKAAIAAKRAKAASRAKARKAKPAAKAGA
jgi:hypothetical protein